MNNINRTIGTAMLLTSHLVMMATFFVAYAGGYSTTVDINNYGEAHVELIILILTFPAVILCVDSLIRGDKDGCRYEVNK